MTRCTVRTNESRMHQKEYKHPHNQTPVIKLQRFTETVTSSLSESTAFRQTAKNANAVMVVQLQAPIILIDRAEDGNPEWTPFTSVSQQFILGLNEDLGLQHDTRP